MLWGNLAQLRQRRAHRHEPEKVICVRSGLRSGSIARTLMGEKPVDVRRVPNTEDISIGAGHRSCPSPSSGSSFILFFPVPDAGLNTSTRSLESIINPSSFPSGGEGDIACDEDRGSSPTVPLFITRCRNWDCCQCAACSSSRRETYGCPVVSERSSEIRWSPSHDYKV